MHNPFCFEFLVDEIKPINETVRRKITDQNIDNGKMVCIPLHHYLAFYHGKTDLGVFPVSIIMNTGSHEVYDAVVPLPELTISLATCETGGARA